MEKSKSYAVAGGIIRNGVLIRHSHGDIARAGAPKRLTDPAIVAGQKRQTKGDLHPNLHGQAINDETSEKLATGKQVPTHSGMKSQTAGNGFDTLRKASDLMCHDRADDQCHSLPSGMKR